MMASGKMTLPAVLMKVSISSGGLTWGGEVKVVTEEEIAELAEAELVI